MVNLRNIIKLADLLQFDQNGQSQKLLFCSKECVQFDVTTRSSNLEEHVKESHIRIHFTILIKFNP